MLFLNEQTKNNKIIFAFLEHKKHTKKRIFVVPKQTKQKGTHLLFLKQTKENNKITVAVLKKTK